MTESITQSKVLVVEGRDAKVFFEALLAHCGLQNIQLFNAGGVNELRGFLKALVNTPGFQSVMSLAVVRDAEQNASAAFQSVCDALRAAGLPIPATIGSGTRTSPKVSVFLLPDGNSDGMLESLCLESVRNDPAMKCVEMLIDCLKDQGLHLPENMTKARAHAFLSTRSRPGLPIGRAAHAGYWQWTDPAFDSLKQFLYGV